MPLAESESVKFRTLPAKAASDPEYLRKQSAKDLAMLHGVMFDKSFRILESVETQKNDALSLGK